MASAVAASRLSDSIRISIAAHQDVAGRADDALYVTVRLHESDDVGLGERRAQMRSVVVRRLYSGRSKALENDALWDVIVGAELSDGKLEHGAFTYTTGARLTVRVSKEPPADGATPFDGVFGLKNISVPGIR